MGEGLSMDLDNLDIKAELTAWGRWASGSRVASAPKGGCVGSCSPLGYKSIWATILPSGGGSGGGCDDDMLTIDAALCNLRFEDKFAYKLIKLKYRYGYSYQRLAQKLTKDLPEYRRGGIKAGMQMHHPQCKIYVDNAEQKVIEELKFLVEKQVVVINSLTLQSEI